MKKTDCVLIDRNTGKEVALKAINIRGTVIGLTCEWQIVQSFANREKTAIEAVYSFPLPDGATLSSMKITTGDRTIVTRPEEKEEAFDKFDEAIQQGNAAFLLDQERADFYVLSLGNLLPDQQVEVRITLFQLLNAQKQSARLCFPVAVVPKYFPADKSAEAQEWERIEPGFASEVPYGFNLSLNLQQDSRIKLIESPGHPLRVANDGNNAEVSLYQANTMPDKDVVISFELAEPFKPALRRCTFNGREHLLFETIPEFGSENDLQKAKEVVFVVDCSGSMAGAAIKEAVNALQICLRSLNEGDLFQVICFGSSFQQLFKETQVFNQVSLDAATRAIAAIDADLGGTEILPALEAAVKTLRHEYASMILFTDGAVGNEDEVIDFAAAHKHRCRIFTFGIGNGASHNMILEVARKSGGMAEFVFDGERIEPKVLNQFRRLSAPVLSNIHMDWAGADIEKTAGNLPAIFSGDVVRFAARCQEGRRFSAAAEVKLTAQYNDRSLEWKPETVSDATTDVPALWWAKQRIQELERGEAAGGSKQKRRPIKKQNSEIIELSKAYGIISSKTSLVGIEERAAADKNAGKPELRRIPVMIPAGRDFMQASFGGASLGIMPEFLRRSTPGAGAGRGLISRLTEMCVSAAGFVRESPAKSVFTETDENDGGFSYPSAVSTASAGTDASEDRLIKILMYAGANGMFAYSQELLDLLEATDEEFAEYLARVAADLPESERRDRAMTLLTKDRLEQRFQPQHAMWAAIVAKIGRKLA